MDVSQDTVTENTLLNTYTAHKSDGTQITGTYVPSGGSVIISDTIDSHGGTIREITTTGDVVMLQEKTVTPSTSQQVITADSETSVVDTVVCTVATRDASVSTSHTWLMTSGESYHVSGSGTINATSITVSDDITWTGSSISVAYTGGQGAYSQVTGITLTPTGVTITYSASGDNYGSLTLEIGESLSYDGLSQVTVNPIPSQYIIPSGTSQITENGSYDITPYSTVNVAISGGSGDSGDIDALITRTVSVYNNSTITSIGRYAFAGCSALTSVEFPLCTTIGQYAFSSCSLLTSISFPKCEYINDFAFPGCSLLTSISFPECIDIGQYAFSGCSLLTSISFPKCEYIGTYAFYSCRSLTSVSFSKCTDIRNGAFANNTSLSWISFPVCSYIWSSAFSNCRQLVSAIFPKCVSLMGSAFYSCDALTTISFPVCSDIGPGAFMRCSLITLAEFPSCIQIRSSAFMSCSSLTTANFARCTSIGMSAFAYCRSLNSIYIPSCSSISNGAFYYCDTLSIMNLPSCTYIATTVFQYCSSLMGLYLTASSLCTLLNGNAFYYTPLSKSVNDVYGSIYVRESLYSSYIVATNWAAYSSRFVSMTDAEIEALPF